MTNEATETVSLSADSRQREEKDRFGPLRTQTAPGDVGMDMFSDGGSTPPASTKSFVEQCRQKKKTL